MNSFFVSKNTVFIIFGVIILLTSALALFFFKDIAISSHKNREAIIKLIEEVWSKGNLQIVDQLVASEYTIKHDPGDVWDGKTIDLNTYKERVKMSRNVFPDQKFYIENLVSENDKVAVSWRFTGTQRGSIPGIPTTNKMVSVSGLTIYYFSNGKISGHWQVVDRLGFLTQLGASKEKP